MTGESSMSAEGSYSTRNPSRLLRPRTHERRYNISTLRGLVSSDKQRMCLQRQPFGLLRHAWWRYLRMPQNCSYSSVNSNATCVPRGVLDGTNEDRRFGISRLKTCSYGIAYPWSGTSQFTLTPRLTVFRLRRPVLLQGPMYCMSFDGTLS